MYTVLQVVPTQRAGLFSTYQPLDGTYDELVATAGAARTHTKRLLSALDALPPREFARYQSLAELSLYNQGVTFSVYSDNRGTEKIMPICLVPRVIGAVEWARAERGLIQRMRALNLFLDDM